MQLLSRARRLTRVLKPPTLLLNTSPAAAQHKLLSSDSPIAISIPSLSFHSLSFSGISQGDRLYSRTLNAPFSTDAVTLETAPTELVKELYDKILDSVNTKRTMAPNAWLWSLIENCRNRDDIRLLFDALQNLRRFRLSNLRIHTNFNCHLCREVTKACTRVGALDFGKKTLWKHNVFGLTPSIASANYLLSYAKDKNDVRLMVEVMSLIKKNDIELQPGTTDIVFSICYNSDKWELISKYSKRFLKAGVKLRKTAFDTWMDFAAKRGDTESLWKIEKLRSETMKQHTLVSGFSCAKGLILERKPQDAAAVIGLLNQILPDAKKSDIAHELQKLISEWPMDVVKHQQEENRKAVTAALKSDIPIMVAALSNLGVEVNVNLEHLTSKEEILS